MSSSSDDETEPPAAASASGFTFDVQIHRPRITERWKLQVSVNCDCGAYFRWHAEHAPPPCMLKCAKCGADRGDMPSEIIAEALTNVKDHHRRLIARN